MTESANYSKPPSPVNDTRPIVVEQSYHYVIQRAYYGPDGAAGWVDSSARYHAGTEEESINARLAATTKRDEMRKIFGEDEVRVVRRDILITEHGIEG